MSKKSILNLLASFIILCLACGCVTAEKSKPQIIVVPGGTVSPALGVGFDVSYDPALDNIIPGYKILSVAYKNNSMNIVQMDMLNDQWRVEDRGGKKITAVINLRDKDPDIWAKLQPRLRKIMEYPLLIAIGETRVIDLLFRGKVNLAEFKSVTFNAARSNQEFKILPREN